MKRNYINNIFSRDRKTLYIIFSIVLISVLSLTIVYAALSVTLNITGNAEVVASSWNIHLDNVKVMSGSATPQSPTITNNQTASFTTTLNKPGEFYVFTIDVVNDGSIDAIIDSVIKTPTLTEEQAKYLKYEIEYQNGEPITTKQLVKSKSFVRLKVRLEYRKDITVSELPTTGETLNLAFTINYVQSDNTENVIVENNGKIINATGSLDDIGTIVSIGTEQFYTIGTDGDNVKLFSMYNLYVGGDYISKVWYPYENPTGKQSSTMLGWIASNTPCAGTTAFSNGGTKPNDYSGSIVEGYVKKYKSILETEYGLPIIEARLITKEELTNPDTFACEFVSGGSSNNCTNSQYEWIYATTYWTSTADEAIDKIDYVYGVQKNGNFKKFNAATPSGLGVRPVIIISKSSF